MAGDAWNGSGNTVVNSSGRDINEKNASFFETTHIGSCMKLNINRESFLKAFQTAAMVAPVRSPRPILQNVKLESRNGSAILTATDTEVGVRLEVPGVEVLAEGSGVFPVSRLSLILRENSDETLLIETSEGKAILKGSRSRFELQTLNSDEFPDVPAFGDQASYRIPAAALRELIRRTLFATDTESSRYALGGVLLEIDGDRLIAVGTDGRRLAKMEAAITREGKPENVGGTTIVPSRSMQLMDRILPDGDEVVHLAIRPNELILQVPNGLFTTRLVEGRFPKWRDAIPNRTASHKIELPVGPLYAALRQAAIVASEESRGIDFAFANGTLVLSSSTAEVGQSRVELPVAFDGEELVIRLDNRYVADFLKVIPPDRTFTLDVENSQSAAWCSTDDHYGYVIMPLQRG